MVEAWLEPRLFMLLCIGGGGVFLSFVGFYGGRSHFFRVAGWLTTVGLGSFGTLAWWFGQPSPLWLTSWGLGGLFALAFALTTPRAVQILTWVCRQSGQMVLWGLLIGTCPFAAVILAWPPQEPDLDLDICLSFQDMVPSQLFTDRGRSITALCPVHPDVDLSQKQSLVLKNAGLQEKVILLPGPAVKGGFAGNCHGWIFAEGKYCIPSTEVPLILEDHGYYPVSRPGPNDLVIYRAPTGQVVHSGIVRCTGPEKQILVESKWGRMGCFLHLHDKHGYPNAVCTFYRSARPGHLLQGLDVSAPMATASTAEPAVIVE